MKYYNDNEPFAVEWLGNLIAAGELPVGTVDGRSIMEVLSNDIKAFTQCHFFAGAGGWPLALTFAGWPEERQVWTGSVPCQPFSCAGRGKGERDERHLWPEFLRLIRECRPPIIFGEQVASSEVVGTQLEAAFVIAVHSGNFARANKLAKRLAQSSGFHYWARWLDRVQADLEGEGYAFRFKILGAHSVAAPHIRQRVFWVAHANGGGEGAVAGVRGRARVGATGIGGVADADKQGNGGGGIPRHGKGNCKSDGPALKRFTGLCETTGGLADTGSERAGESRKTEARQREQQSGRAVELSGHGDTDVTAGWDDYRIVECRDLDKQGRPKFRRVPNSESGIQPLAHGVPRKLGPSLAGMGQVGIRAARTNRAGRLRGYGNAIVVLTAAKFIRAYMEM